jgi:hypothetical protein
MAFIVTIATGVIIGVLTFIALWVWNTWLGRRRVELLLIERTNRLEADPKVNGITLARVVKFSDPRQLEEIKQLYEYRLKLHNTSSLQIEDAEIQFDFPSTVVVPTVSRTAKGQLQLEEVDSPVRDPNYAKALRWKIPSLYHGDSVDFTFRVVDPASENYAVALYKSKATLKKQGPEQASNAYKIATLVLAASMFGVLATLVIPGSGSTGWQEITAGGCTVDVLSTFQQYQSDFRSRISPWRGPWLIHHEFYNPGPNCIVTSPMLFNDPKGKYLVHGQTTEWTMQVLKSPRLVEDITVRMQEPGDLESKRQAKGYQ